MALVAVTAVLSWLVFRWDADTDMRLSVGWVTVPLVFSVLEADTGRPIEGAVIRLLDFDFESSTAPPDYLELKTGPDGRAATSLNLRFTMSEEIPSGKLRSYCMHYPGWDMYVMAAGYPDVLAAFADHERGNRRFHEYAPPPAVVFRLRREPRPGDSKSAFETRKAEVLRDKR